MYYHSQMSGMNAGRHAVIVKGSIQKNQWTTSNYHTETFISTEGWRRRW